MMTQFVYWHAPLWQVLVVAATGLLLLAWLLVLAVRRPKLSAALAAVDPALASQPAIYFDRAGGFVALNAGAEALLHEWRQSNGDALSALADALWEAEVEARASQLDTILPDKTVVIVPVFRQPDEVSGVVAMVMPRPALATITPAPAALAMQTSEAESWLALGPALRMHRTRAEIQVKRSEPSQPGEEAAWQESTLTNTEQRLLRALLQHPDEAQPAKALFQWVWPGEDVDELGLRPDQRDRLRRLVFNVRQKIELDPRAPRLLRTMHGLGYALHVDQKDAAP
ncbi:MAG TPA: helix-turn-helix domain-containing protein [Anaerolineae bacterium]|nr:helix-turn-helix domain-containing protein [Anaerolineae bacterium]HNU03782.1 helix-turn-helix domain-containing protein [Anaerolineae bacterium]